MLAQLCEYTKKTIELYSLNGQSVWYVNYILIKLLLPPKKMVYVFSTGTRCYKGLKCINS